MSKRVIYIGATFGGIVGGWLPSLWGADIFSPWSITLSTIGGLAGIWAAYKIQQ